ncbi:MAG: hypothetical protein IJM55_00580 [Ruminococcus sp.]|nr:hypothetical protein [Ruminococcus sp.]
MKDQTIKNINDLGKISRIIVIIMKIAVIVGIVCTIIAGVALCLIKGDALKFSGFADGEIVLDTEGLPKNFIRIDESDETLKWFGSEMKVSLAEDKEHSGDGQLYKLDASVDALEYGDVKPLVVGGCFCITAFLAVTMIALIFGEKLAKALEKCDSPFEDSVMKAMGNFGKSLIPMAVFMVVLRGLSGVSTFLAILVVLLFIQVFKYGAKLQKESDETL